MQGCPLGIFGKLLARPEERVLETGERVEIYRPLIADPRRYAKQRAARARASAKAVSRGGSCGMKSPANAGLLVERQPSLRAGVQRFGVGTGTGWASSTSRWSCSRVEPGFGGSSSALPVSAGRPAG